MYSPVRLIGSLLLASALWTLMFCPLWQFPMPFWYAMSGSAVLLLCCALTDRLCEPSAYPTLHSPSSWRMRIQWLATQIALGIGIAIVLWCVFWLGDKVSQWMFPSFARNQVDTIYGMKEGFSSTTIGILLLFLIGPTEEIFWRGYIQHRLQERSYHYKGNPLSQKNCRAIGAILGIVCYTAIHIPSCNFMLIVAAAVCGIAWGGIYWYKQEWLPALIISHALWDAAAFVWFPF